MTDKTPSKPGLWWIKRDTTARIRGVDKARAYLKEQALFGQLDISFAHMEQAIWLAIVEADSGSGGGQ